MCAEQSALTAAQHSFGLDKVARIAVAGGGLEDGALTGELICTPCGGCRQRIREFAAEHPDPLLRRRAEMIPHIAEGPDPSATALSMYTTAHAVDEVLPGGYWEERRRQAEWLRERLGLV